MPSPKLQRMDLDIPGRLTKWALWGCVSVMVVGLFLLLGFALVMVGTPLGRSRLQRLDEIRDCRDRLSEVAGALGRYVTVEGNLPPTLETLHPEYLRNPLNLRCPADPVEGVDASFNYRPEAGWGDPEVTVVFCPHHWVKPGDDPADSEAGPVNIITGEGEAETIRSSPDALAERGEAAPPV
jgi:hypothetical protein